MEASRARRRCQAAQISGRRTHARAAVDAGLRPTRHRRSLPQETMDTFHRDFEQEDMVDDIIRKANREAGGSVDGEADDSGDGEADGSGDGEADSSDEVGETKPYSYLAVVFNSAMWVEFGIPAMLKLAHSHRHTLADWLGVPLMIANAIGVIVELIYVGIFLRFAVRHWWRTLISLLGIAFVSLAVLLVLWLKGWSRTFVGYFAMFSGVAMYGIPVYTTCEAYWNNDVTQISAFQASASLANGVIWTAYSCIGHVPNFAAIICASGQLYVWRWLKVRAMEAADAAAALAEAAEAVRRAVEQDLEAGDGRIIASQASQSGDGRSVAAQIPESRADDAVVGASRGIASQASESGAGSVATGDGGAAQGMGGAGADKQVLIEMPKLGGGDGGNDDVENQVQQGAGENKVQQGAGENKDDGGGVGIAEVDKSEEDDAV
ncbi:hypothetical protein QYE76_026258 [Lolium multiflorum]|uniref:Uncharacterized protein n=1 Tax=Lolium multiflorum TaxID=4521 RepID=A0AAD8RHD2_LOLMU|nr:hypothetical protein QYE76_026258 [Lolium multiflorum]